jgi:hypothetical protein
LLAHLNTVLQAHQRATFHGLKMMATLQLQMLQIKVQPPMEQACS